MYKYIQIAYQLTRIMNLSSTLEGLYLDSTFTGSDNS